MKQHKRTPLFTTLLNHARRRVTSFHTPGHKNGESIDPQLLKFTGRNVYYLDVTVFPEVDSLHDPTGAIKRAQELMAQAYGVKQSFFLVNGSSVGNMAMFLAATRPGDSVIISRSAHKSVMSAVILAGVWPIWIQPKIDQDKDIILDPSPEQIEQTLNQYPEAKAVFITSPTYNGIVTDLFKIAQICHQRAKVLLVDEAHGPHLKFHPDLPVSAVEAGADLCVQSTHKILSALSQGSVLHFQSELIDANRVAKIVSLLQTTSPNYFILASLDLARRQVVLQGEKTLSRIIDWANWCRDNINRLSYFRCFTRREIQKIGFDLDETKLTINVTRTGLSGQRISDILSREYNIQVDCADIFNLIAILGMGTTRQHLQNLLNALKSIGEKYHGNENNWVLHIPSLATEMVMSPREVFLAKRSKRIPLKKAVGHIAAQTLTPYPPGIPILIPGERITKEICDYLEELRLKNIRISGQETEYLKTIKVVSG